MQTERSLDRASAGDGATKTPTQASQGVKLGTMRWVLGISMALAVVGVAIAYFVA
jgi:hypothetical protein